MRNAFQFSLQSLLVLMAFSSLVLAASAGAFGPTVQVMVFGTAAYMLMALLILGLYLAIAAMVLTPLFGLAWLLDRNRTRPTVASSDAGGSTPLDRPSAAASSSAAPGE